MFVIAQKLQWRRALSELAAATARDARPFIVLSPNYFQ